MILRKNCSFSIKWCLVLDHNQPLKVNWKPDNSVKTDDFIEFFVWPTRTIPRTVTNNGIKINATGKPLPLLQFLMCVTQYSTSFNMCVDISMCCTLHQSNIKDKGARTRHACRLVDIFLWIVITNDARLVVRFPFRYNIQHIRLCIRILAVFGG